MKKSSNIGLLVLLMLSINIFAATDGINDSTSTGTVEVRVNKGDGVRVSNLQDINFGSGNTVPGSQIDDICVYSTTGSYTLTASSDGNAFGGSWFIMINSGTADLVRYFVEYRDDTFSQNGTNLLHNTTSTTYNNADTVSDTCLGGVNSRLIFKVDPTTFNAATPGSYVDTLTLLVQPI